MTDVELLTTERIDHMVRRCAILSRDGRSDQRWTTHTVMCALATILDLQAKLSDRDARLADAAAQIEALRAEVERGRGALLRLANAADDVGIRFFDTDTMEPEVEAMQGATKAARGALAKIDARTGDLPDWDDVRGIAPSATGRVSSEDFIRELRDNWPTHGCDSLTGDPDMPSTRCPDEIDLDRPLRGYLPRRKRRHSHQFGWSLEVCGYDVDILVRADYAVLPGLPATDIDPPEYPMMEDATFEVSFDGGRHWISPGDAFADALAEDERVRGILLDAAERE